MESLSIGEVSKRSGLQSSAIRYYESIGILPHAERVNGRRQYGDEVLMQLKIVHVAKEAGFTLPEIRTLVGGFSETDPPSKRWKTMARAKVEEVDQLIERAQRMKLMLVEGLECDCLQLDVCALILD